MRLFLRYPTVGRRRRPEKREDQTTHTQDKTQSHAPVPLFVSSLRYVLVLFGGVSVESGSSELAWPLVACCSPFGLLLLQRRCFVFIRRHLTPFCLLSFSRREVRAKVRSSARSVRYPPRTHTHTRKQKGLVDDGDRGVLWNTR